MLNFRQATFVDFTSGYIWSIRYQFDLGTAGKNNAGIRTVSEFIRDNRPSGARVGFSKPKLLAFCNGKQYAVYPKANAQAIAEYLKSMHADYLVASSASESDRTLIFPLANPNTELLEAVFESDGAAVYRNRYAQ
jgi:hypothetical protein